MNIDIKIHLGLSPRQKRIVRGSFVTSVAIAILGVGIAIAAPKNTFHAQDALSADLMNQNFVDLDNRLSKPTITKGGKQYSLGATYCGSTAGTPGDMSALAGGIGYDAAKKACETSCSSLSAHMCTSEELTRTAQLGEPRPPAPQAWYSAGVYAVGVGGVAVADCLGWTKGDTAWQGAVWGAPPSPGYQRCDDAQVPVACCD